MPSADDLLWQLAVPTRLGEKPTLDRMRRLLSALGDPHRGMPVLHVGGTSGKGSTATIAARILSEAGYRVGLHAKPHLERVEERFVVDGRPISSKRLVSLLHAASDAAARVGPTWYELTVAIALQHFCKERVDVAVVEVGLGGTHDGTNVVEPLAVVLTNVSLDHTEVLGDTVEMIARDDVGIFKPGVPIVSGVSQKTVRRIVECRSVELGALLWQLGEQIRCEINEIGPDGGRFNLDLPTRCFSRLRIGLRGAHQVENAALAVAGIEALGISGFTITEEAIRRALTKVELPGRLEVVGRDPLVILDGAHNPAKMSALAAALKALYGDRAITAVLAFKRGHDLLPTLAPLLPLLRCAVITRFDADTDFGRSQSLDPLAVQSGFDELGATCEKIVEPDPVRAVGQALKLTEPRGLVCVTGSLYLIGAVRPWLIGPYARY